MKQLDEQLEVIKRGAVDIISEAELVERLKESIRSNKPLRVKFGADPTAPDLHLGHTVVLRKMRQFQDLGHRVVFIIGDFTGLVGDPSGRNEARKAMNKDEIETNAQTYQQQFSKILDPEKTTVVFNSSWFDKMDFRDVLELASKYTVARLLERDDFAKRFQKGIGISVLEFLYPLIQGYDSVAVKADIELGGTDQLFNLLVGRELQREYGQKSQIVLTMPLLEGTDGAQKMSKSLGNYIGINEPPLEIYGKIMSINDTLMFKYYTLLTDVPIEQINQMQTEIAQGKAHPKKIKEKLALIITSMYHGEKEAARAKKAFDIRHGSTDFDTKIHALEIPEYKLDRNQLDGDEIWICKLLNLSGLAPSNSQARRLIQGGGVRLDGEKITDFELRLKPRDGMVLQVGSRRMVRIRDDRGE